MLPLPPHSMEDHIYKTVEGVKIPLRVWLPHNVSRPLPTLVFVHGGGGTVGNHYLPTPWILQLFLNHGWAIMSMAHRFLPHVSCFDQIQDISDAVHFTREQYAGVLDMDRWVLSGTSSGTALGGVALCEELFDPMPCAWVPIAGSLDLTKEMYSPHYTEDNRPPYDPNMFPRIPAHSPTATDHGPGRSRSELVELWQAPNHPFNGREEDQYRYMGLMFATEPDGSPVKSGKGVKLGREFRRADTFETEEAFRAEAKRLSMFHRVKDGLRWAPNLRVYFVQGENDVWCPAQWTRDAQEELNKRGYITAASYIPGFGHSEPEKLLDRDDPQWEEYIEPIIKFCQEAREAPEVQTGDHVLAHPGKRKRVRYGRRALAGESGKETEGKRVKRNRRANGGKSILSESGSKPSVVEPATLSHA